MVYLYSIIKVLCFFIKVFEGFLNLVIGQFQVFIYGDQRGLDLVLIVVVIEVGDGVRSQTIFGDLFFYQIQNFNFWEVFKVIYIYKLKGSKVIYIFIYKFRGSMKMDIRV